MDPKAWLALPIFLGFSFCSVPKPAVAGTFTNLPTDHLYTGQTRDDHTNLYYYHTRYYDPVLGIFTSADRASGPNRYSYVEGNPIMRNDPTGEGLPTDSDDVYFPRGWWWPWPPTVAEVPSVSGHEQQIMYNITPETQLGLGLWNACSIACAAMSMQYWHSVNPANVYSSTLSLSDYFVQLGLYDKKNMLSTDEVQKAMLGLGYKSSELGYVTEEKLFEDLGKAPLLVTATYDVKKGRLGSLSPFFEMGADRIWNPQTPEGLISHAVLVIGVDDKWVYLNDPYTGKLEKYTREEFLVAWRFRPLGNKEGVGASLLIRP